MKYAELINFEPITEVVKFSRTTESDYQKSLVKSFVFSKAFKENLIPLIVKNLDYNRTGESFGLQVVGNYGTGKSHLMSLISLVAENEQLLELVNEAHPRNDLQPIAGKFKVLRFELGNTDSLWEVITYKMEEYLSDNGISFSFEGHGPKTFFEKVQLMMSEFEDKFPDKGFLVVIDEMLAYLKGRSTPDKLNSDLQVLQAFGQACDSTKFKFIFGVQEMIYHSPEFQFAAEMLQKVNDRYKDVIITKEDVAFIVKNRLLRKDEHQKQKIRAHLEPFLKFFKDMHSRTQDYIDLFPVHPTYFENFERIRIGKSQREILKTLSNQFSRILDNDVPTNNPGLLTYDRYWKDMQSSQDLMANPDVRKVKEVSDTVFDKIESYFTGVRARKKEVAQRIVNACAIKVLQHELNKQNGTNSEHLVDDLCLTDTMADDREFLLDIIDSTSQKIITATSGQYFDKDPDNDEYHIRIEGGVNFDQKIKDYAPQISDEQKDVFFFKFLIANLPIHHDPYRTGFNIWAYSIEWKSHKTFRDGYIFFGNPNSKSTTQPKQHFYMYFMPIFDETKKKRNHEADEVYFIMDDLSEGFKDLIALYGAAISLEASADSSQKPFYHQKKEEVYNKAKAIFEKEYIQVTKVDYKGKELPLSGYSILGAGATKQQIFSDVASQVLENWFVEELPHYPKFSQLSAPIAKDNFLRLIKQALVKIEKPLQANRDGEGVLCGLGLWVPGKLDYSHSPYAKSILNSLKDKGSGKVLNRDEILKCIHPETNLWVSKDFGIEAGLEFLVLATLAAVGEVEVTLQSGKKINATNLNELQQLEEHDFYTFGYVAPPKEINFAAIKAVFEGLLGKDLSKQLKVQDTYTQLYTAATDWSKRTVTLLHKIQGGFSVKGIEIVSDDQAAEYRREFSAFAGFCDKLQAYDNEARLRNFKYPTEEVNRLLETKGKVESLEAQLQEVKNFEEALGYLDQTKQYLMDGTLKTDIVLAIQQFPELIKSVDTKRKEAYQQHLYDLKSQYADWYLKQYLDHRISESDHTKKMALLDADEKYICDILKDAEFLSSGQYQQLLDKLNMLQPADPKVNKEAILTTPYQDFNPRDYAGKPISSVQEIKCEMGEILDQWIDTLKETLEDPMAKKNMPLLGDENKINLLKDFKTGNVQIDRSNAQTIRNAIMELYKGLDKIELNDQSLKSVFNKPLTPDEAINAFKSYIDLITTGKERDKIRIILK